MKRVLLDTNIYGDVVERGDAAIIRSLAEKGVHEILAVYGNSVVRKELREIPRKAEVSRKLRLAVLSLYDLLVGGRSLELTAGMCELAENYLRAYKELKGQLPRSKLTHEKLYNDFLIVATATMKNLDVVYLSDAETMLSEEALKAYRIVNDVKKLRTPGFETYGDFMRELRRCGHALRKCARTLPA